MQFFGFGVLCGLWVFSNLVFGFQFLSTMMADFRIFLPNAFYSFSGFAKDVPPHSHAKTVIPRDYLQLEECMASLVSLTAFFWVVNGCQADYEKLKITSKQKAISQISCGWDNFL